MKSQSKSGALGKIGATENVCLAAIQGWIKGVNSETLDPVHDMGQDCNYEFIRNYKIKTYEFKITSSLKY